MEMKTNGNRIGQRTFNFVDCLAKSDKTPEIMRKIEKFPCILLAAVFTIVLVVLFCSTCQQEEVTNMKTKSNYDLLAEMKIKEETAAQMNCQDEGGNSSLKIICRCIQ